MRNRIILAALTFLIWAGLRAIDDYVTGPEVLTLLYIVAAMMISHSIWLFAAQGRWRRKLRRAALKETHAASLRPPTTEAEDAASNWHPWIDIFISAKNEQRVIENTIRNFFRIDYDKFFLWIIDDCSTDQTGSILENLKKEFPRLRVVQRAKGSYPGKSAALNDALPLAKGEVVAVFDADAYVAPDFFHLMLPVLEPEGIGAVQAQKKIYEQQKGFLVNCQASEYAVDTYFQVGRDIIGGTVELRGNGQMIKRAALVDVGGWNNKAITDDLDLTMRLLVHKWDLRFCPHAHVWEEGVPTLKGLLRQRRRWAEGSIRRYLDYIFPLNSPTRVSLVERLDTLAFVTYLVVPALICLEVSSELTRMIMHVPTYGKFLGLISLAVFFCSQINCFVSIRLYRPQMSLGRALVHSLECCSYVYAHWMPVIFVSYLQIIFGKQASTWHRTEHGQVSELQPTVVMRDAS